MSRPSHETSGVEAVSSDHVTEAGICGGLGQGLSLILNQDYFNIPSFMSDQTLVDVVTLTACPYAGFTDKEYALAGIVHIPKGRRLKLPLAAASILHEKEFVQVHRPAILEDNVMANLRRNPIVVHVKLMHPYYFEFGIKMATLLEDEKLREDLLEASRQRVTLLMDLAAEEVDEEQRRQQTTGALIPQISTDTNRVPLKGIGHRRAPNINRSNDTATSQSMKVTFAGSTPCANRSVNVGLFLEGISVSESMRKR